MYRTNPDICAGGRLVEALDASPSRSAADALKLLILTCLRKNEVQQLEWRRVILADGTVYLAHSTTQTTTR